MMKWVMAYTEIRPLPGHSPRVKLGHHVTGTHPLVTIARWAARDAERRAAGATGW